MASDWYYGESNMANGVVIIAVCYQNQRGRKGSSLPESATENIYIDDFGNSLFIVFCRDAIILDAYFQQCY